MCRKRCRGAPGLRTSGFRAQGKHIQIASTALPRNRTTRRLPLTYARTSGLRLESPAGRRRRRKLGVSWLPCKLSDDSSENGGSRLAPAPGEARCIISSGLWYFGLLAVESRRWPRVRIIFDHHATMVPVVQQECRVIDTSFTEAACSECAHWIYSSSAEACSIGVGLKP